jgi:hypothetical protein
MKTRIEFSEMLKANTHCNNFYFQPPETTKLKYPCIIYRLENYQFQYGDNIKYVGHKRYNVTYVDKDPDSNVPDEILKLPMSSFNTFYTSENLNHWSFSIYY